MMRKILLLAMVCLVLAVPAMALSLDFQSSTDTASITQITYGPGSGLIQYEYNPSGGNSYMAAYAGSVGNAYIRNLAPLETTYGAATLCSGGTVIGGAMAILLYDSGANLIYTYSSSTVYQGRWEVKMVGGQAHIYQNGVEMAVSGALGTNPSYIGWGASQGPSGGFYVLGYDDIVMGDSENHNIYGMPETGFWIKKDLINPATYGLAFPNGTLVPGQAFNMTSTWASDSSAAKIIQLQDASTGQVVGSYTSSSLNGTKRWPIYDMIINNPSAPSGYYVTTFSGNSAPDRSLTIPYQSGGAAVTWGSSYYSQNDMATVNSVISPTYWIPASYTYRVVIRDIYGTIKQTTAITMASQTVDYQFTSSDIDGVFVAILYATPTAGGDDIVLNAGTTTLTGYVRLSGIIFNGENSTHIDSPNISITQGSVVSNSVPSQGNYATSAGVAFGTGSTLRINVTKAGYWQYDYSFIPTAAKSLNITIVLKPFVVNKTGLLLRGVARDNVYGNPVDSPSISAYNSSTGEMRNVTANALGYYSLDDDRGTGNILANGRCYNILATKGRYIQTAPIGVTCVVAT